MFTFTFQSNLQRILNINISKNRWCFSGYNNLSKFSYQKSQYLISLVVYGHYKTLSGDLIFLSSLFFRNNLLGFKKVNLVLFKALPPNFTDSNGHTLK